MDGWIGFVLSILRGRNCRGLREQEMRQGEEVGGREVVHNSMVLLPYVISVLSTLGFLVYSRLLGET